ncbi:class I SAM-dependent methyltransferase [Brachyspira pilosicoli]|uniref:Class I SAM-dependent methyltransferase n=1 Tax=Brachyspira pilosicoli TaxID=52584 RepID=A0AAJ6GGA6_BRAPL|nr:class I SAM-dependent methyltransferase [Brachyspira pilosicoli]WIH91279.1 class I SAM-dependent methyltransferase [Brachyspira pilosicoli]WIH93570.1 class I SAM-dependent methyltransferase [Brachyspira pilosicoli]WIH95859.1 class I SAM-dependent methyltransferase [Brachyspira pilosicoli]
MEESRKSIIVDHYINRVNDLNIPDYKVVDWESEEAQNLRFKALIEHFNMSSNVLLDVGCGVGSLAEYIDKNNINLYYIGIDIMPEMVERAKSKNYKNINPQFMTMDFFKKTDIKDDVDYIYTSGIFNLNLGNNEEFLKEAIEAFLLAARKGVCFNLLDISCKEKYGDKYYYYKKDDILLLTQDILKKLNLSYKIHIEDKYLQNDFSVFIDY